jgi:hypothetical protein
MPAGFLLSHWQYRSEVRCKSCRGPRTSDFVRPLDSPKVTSVQCTILGKAVLAKPKGLAFGLKPVPQPCRVFAHRRTGIVWLPLESLSNTQKAWRQWSRETKNAEKRIRQRFGAKMKDKKRTLPAAWYKGLSFEKGPTPAVVAAKLPEEASRKLVDLTVSLYRNTVKKQ